MKRVIVFGIGNECKVLLQKGLLQYCHVVAFVDSNKARWREKINISSGGVIAPPEIGLQRNFDMVLIATTAYAAEIQTQLTDTFSIPKEKICLWQDFVREAVYAEAYEKKEGFLLYHKPSFFTPEAVLSEGEKEESCTDLIDRIIEAYHRTLAYFNECGESRWTTGYLWECKEHIHKTLLSKKKEDVISILDNPIENKMFRGFDDVAPWDMNTMARLIYDNTVQLAAYLGIVRMPNTEFAECIPRICVDYLFDQIAESYGFDLQFPNLFSGVVGIKTKRGIVGWRTIQSLYQAIRIYELIKEKDSGVKILEIGAGLGETAYFAYQMGLRDYTIIDIPLTNVVQEYFLGRAIGAERVSFVGEEPDKDIKILPFYTLPDLEKKRFDLILNVDSITEMDEASQESYWKYIQTHADIFFSINHEGNPHTVRELYQGTEAKVRRGICPMRRGYIEEEVYFG